MIQFYFLANLFKFLFKIGMNALNNNKNFLAKIIFRVCFFSSISRIESIINYTYLLINSKNKYNKAIKILKKELIRNYDTYIESQLAYFIYLKGDLVEAKEIYSKIINKCIIQKTRIDPQEVINLINIYNQLKEYSNSIKLFDYYNENTLDNERESKNSYLYYNIGNTYLQLKNYNKAIKYYNMSLAFINHEVYKTFYNLGYCYYEKKQYKKSIEYFLQSINKIDKNKLALGKTFAAIGYSYREIRDLEKAKSYLEKAVRFGELKAQEDLDNIGKNE